MRVHVSIQKAAWASMLLLVSVGLIAALSGIISPYNSQEALLVLLVAMIMVLPLGLMLYPNQPETGKRVITRYVDGRAPEGFDTQA